jgi:predicted metalloprotease
MAGGGLLGLVLVIVVVLLGGDPRPLLQQMQNQAPPQQAGPRPADPEQDALAQFVSVVLADTEDVWTELFRASGKVYRKPVLVLFSGQVRSACGFQAAATGPFYCPLDEHVYIDLSFYDEMKSRLGAPGDFAQAYVIAHEIGHHVQKLLEISEGSRPATTRERDASQRAFRAAGASSGLPRRRLGAPCTAELADTRTGRRGRGAACGNGHR